MSEKTSLDNTGIQPESVRKAMEMAWIDHHHARDQTWKTLQIVAVLAAGLLTIDFTYQKIIPTLCAAILVIISAGVGAGITWSHRKLERRKFIHIMNCEEFLGLHRDFLIPLSPSERLFSSPPTMKRIKYEDEKNRKYKKTNNEIIEEENDIFWLLNDSMVNVPEKFRFIHLFHPKKNNTALFILRMHIMIICFCLLILILRFLSISTV